MMWMKRFVVVVVVAGLGAGCSPYKAASQPQAKNLDLFEMGTDRALLIAEFGAPLISEMKDGERHEIFKFVDGYSGASRTGRAMAHGVADVATLGLWELAGTSIEGSNGGIERAYDVIYDEDDRVVWFAVLK